MKLSEINKIHTYTWVYLYVKKKTMYSLQVVKFIFLKCSYVIIYIIIK